MNKIEDVIKFINEWHLSDGVIIDKKEIVNFVGDLQIEFDGRIDYCTNHGSYNTRFDYLVSAGDYDPDHQIGPTFKFEDVNYFDLNTDIDTVSIGLNVCIKAKVESFDSNSGLFYLEPVKITER